MIEEDEEDLFLIHPNIDRPSNNRDSGDEDEDDDDDSTLSASTPTDTSITPTETSNIPTSEEMSTPEGFSTPNNSPERGEVPITAVNPRKLTNTLEGMLKDVSNFNSIHPYPPSMLRKSSRSTLYRGSYSYNRNRR